MDPTRLPRRDACPLCNREHERDAYCFGLYPVPFEQSDHLNWDHCPHCGDWCVLDVHGVAACRENR